MIILNIYGYNAYSDNDNLFDVIGKKILFYLNKHPDSLLVMGGDFNLLLDNNLDRFPPRKSKPHNTALVDFMEKFNIVDVWRLKFSSSKFYTWSSKDLSRQSQIDYWLVSQTINTNDVQINFHPCPLTDHNIIAIKIEFCLVFRISRAVCWMLNSSLLLHSEVKVCIPPLIHFYWKKAYNQNSFKYEIGKYKIL